MNLEGTIEVRRLNEDAKVLQVAHEDGDLGYDIFSNETFWLHSGTSSLVGTGIAVKPPEGWGFFVKDRSSYASGNKLETAAGVIDEGYRGEVKILIRNHSTSDYRIEKGDKVAQLVPIPNTKFDIKEVSDLDESERGSDGFGSTGND